MTTDSPLFPLVECVPNFSEGRRAAVIDAIADAIASAPVHILDVSSDSDHNRTVVTFVGSPDQVVEGAFRGVEAAARWIDLEAHHGVHPRIGAADVIPFVPLRGVSLKTCVELARRLGARVGAELGIAVYLYEAAASRPDRVNLADVRRGGYELLRTAIEIDPARAPDFGPRRLGRAGASAVGARLPLIAFNAYLDTSDVTIARQIAAVIRAANGGLPCLKALGLLVGGQAQVSMNLTDFRTTGLYAALNAVETEARQRGTSVTRTELVGLIPQAALIDYAVQSLRLPDSARHLLLEPRIGAAVGDYRPIPFDE
jgi:glutamate formiminotransferase